MSTSFPNNGNVPPYNSQMNGSFNQFGQGAPPGAFPGMDQFHHPNMYGQTANGYGGMPNMGGPPQAQPGGPPQPQKTLAPPQYPGAGAGGVKLPAYDGNPMQNGYGMAYPPQRPGPAGQNAQNPMMGQANGPPPSYNGHPHMPPTSNPYNGVSDPYRMYPGMPGQPGQPPPGAQRPMPPAPNAAQPSQQRPPPQPSSQQYPTQQPLPAHLHPSAQQYPQMTSPNAPLQHYQPANFGNSTPPVRGASQAPSAAKAAKDAETRPNALPPQFSNQYPPNFGAPGGSGAGTPSGPFGGYGAAPGGFPGYGMHGGPGRPDTAGTPGSTPGMNGTGINGHTTPGAQPPHGFNTPNGFTPNYPNSNMPGNSGQFAQPGNAHQFGANQAPGANGNSANFGTPGTTSNEAAGSGRGTPGNYGSHGTPGHQTPGSQRQATPSAPSTPTPGTPGGHGPHGSVPPAQSPLAHQQHQLRTPPPTLQQQQPMQNQMPPQYNQPNMMSPNHSAAGNGSGSQTPVKQPARSPMGSSLPPLNSQYPMGHGQGQGSSMPQSPVNPTAPEPTFKEPAVPIRHSPAHMPSPVHPPPLQQPPAYSQPSTSNQKPPEAPRPASPTFAVPTLPAAATLAQASSANQVSTKPKTSPTKKKGEDAHEPPAPDTPFTLVTHFEMPAAMVILRDALSTKGNPQLEKYFTRKRQKLRVAYPEGVNVHNVPATEPDTFGFLQGTKYFNQKYSRGIPIPSPMGPPMLARSQSMHAPMMSPSFNAQQASTSGRQPAKKARSASDASEPSFTMPLLPSRQQMRQNDPRMQQQMQMQHYQQQMHQQQQQHQHQQMQKHMQQQQLMARQNQMGGGISPGQGPTPLPPLAPPSLQRADSMPQLPSQQTMGSMPGHMGGMPPMNGSSNGAEGLTPINSTGLSSGTHGTLPPLSLGSQGQVHQTGPNPTRSHEFGQGPSTSTSQAPVPCAGCHNFILPGSPSLCCMYHDCKNEFHRECTRLSPSAYSRFAQETHVRWVCPTCEPQMRTLPVQPA